jgi:hypothetical protein
MARNIQLTPRKIDAVLGLILLQAAAPMEEFPRQPLMKSVTSTVETSNLPSSYFVYSNFNINLTSTSIQLKHLS